jgi:hypothetical protein
MPYQPKGPKKVRVPGTNRWVIEGTPEALELRDDIRAAQRAAVAVVDEGPDEFDESGWEAVSDLGPRPEPAPKPPPSDAPDVIYYHAYYRNLRVKRGRKDAVRWRNGAVWVKKDSPQEERVRHYLVKYVPGGNPDRWMGDTLDADEEDLRCPECAYFTRNTRVWRDHMKHTGHDRP